MQTRRMGPRRPGLLALSGRPGGRAKRRRRPRPREALEDDSILYAFQQANDALEEACDQADELVSLAEELNHEIRR